MLFDNLTKRKKLMKQKLLGAIVVFLMGFCFISLPQSATAGSLQSFVTDEYYLGAGGQPPALGDFATNPHSYLRSTAAYNALKKGFAAKLGRTLSDAEFRSILASDQVRLRKCTGRISTAGISQQGKVGWSTRSCYAGEKLIELRTGDRWQVVASQGCFNLVRPLPVAPKPKPKPPALTVTSKPVMDSPKVFIQETYGLHVHTNQCCHGCGSSSIYLPGSRAILVK